MIYFSYYECNFIISSVTETINENSLFFFEKIESSHLSPQGNIHTKEANQYITILFKATIFNLEQLEFWPLQNKIITTAQEPILAFYQIKNNYINVQSVYSLYNIYPMWYFNSIEKVQCFVTNILICIQMKS